MTDTLATTPEQDLANLVTISRALPGLIHATTADPATRVLTAAAHTLRAGDTIVLDDEAGTRLAIDADDDDYMGPAVTVTGSLALTWITRMVDGRPVSQRWHSHRDAMVTRILAEVL